MWMFGGVRVLERLDVETRDFLETWHGTLLRQERMGRHQRMN
jgi:hypothetical protein